MFLKIKENKEVLKGELFDIIYFFFVQKACGVTEMVPLEFGSSNRRCPLLTTSH